MKMLNNIRPKIIPYGIPREIDYHEKMHHRFAVR